MTGRRGRSPINPTVSELKIGPFMGGINRYSDPSAIADTELVDCNNFDIDLDGSLKSRPPWNTLCGDQYVGNTGVTEGYDRVIGSSVVDGLRVIFFQGNYIVYNGGGVTTYNVGIYFVPLDGPNAGTSFLIANNNNTTGLNYNNNYSNVIRYKDSFYVFRSLGGANLSLKFSITPATGAVAVTTTSYPPASKAFIYKERAWLVGDKNTATNSRMYFSDVADPNTYQPASFFDIRPGDGDTLNDAIVYQDNVYLFKNGSIWVFAYDTQPNQAVLQQLHNSLGVDNESSVALYENVIYFLKWNQVYQIANYDFTLISTKIPFEEDKTLPTTNQAVNWVPSTKNKWVHPNFLSLVGNRIVVRYFNRIYVYHIRVRSWTRWSSQDPVVNYMGQIVKVEDAGVVPSSKTTYSTYVAGCAIGIVPFYNQFSTMAYSVIQMKDTYDVSTKEGTNWVGNGPNYPTYDIKLSIKTKIYDVGISHRYKRLMHWGVDVVTGRSVTGTLSPFSLAYRVTWDQIATYTWAQLQTWGYPLFTQPSVTQDAIIDTGVYRRFIRFPKSLRYRLLQFEIAMNTTGNTSDGPARLYSITAFNVLKQLVPKGAN